MRTVPAHGSGEQRAVDELAAALREARSGLARVPEVLEGVLEDAGGRGAAVLDRVTGRRGRRWPWAAPRSAPRGSLPP